MSKNSSSNCQIHTNKYTDLTKCVPWAKTLGTFRELGWHKKCHVSHGVSENLECLANYATAFHIHIHYYYYYRTVTEEQCVSKPLSDKSQKIFFEHHVNRCATQMNAQIEMIATTTIMNERCSNESFICDPKKEKNRRKNDTTVRPL